MVHHTIQSHSSHFSFDCLPYNESIAYNHPPFPALESLPKKRWTILWHALIVWCAIKGDGIPYKGAAGYNVSLHCIDAGAQCMCVNAVYALYTLAHRGANLSHNSQFHLLYRRPHTSDSHKENLSHNSAFHQLLKVMLKSVQLLPISVELNGQRQIHSSQLCGISSW